MDVFRTASVCLFILWTSFTARLHATDGVNVVFIYADDLGWGDLSCHGHPLIKTPNLDRLAAAGTDFQQFTVGNPVCSPSRTGVMTGQFPSRWGVHQHFATHESNVARGMPDWLDPAAPMLPRILKEAGYRTAHYGKWHLSGGGVKDAPLPDEYGFDDAATYTGGGRHVFEGTPYGKMISASAAHDLEAASFLSVASTDHTLKFIRESGDQPFYVNLWLHETHALVTATNEEKAAYEQVDEPERTYYAAVSRADREVGRVLDLLDELSLAETTIVIFSSDNGPENPNANVGSITYHSRGETGGLRGRKRSLLLGGINVPFFVRWPGVVPAGRVDTTTAITGVDLLPTLVDATGATLPDEAWDGESVMAAFRGEPFTRSKPIFWFWQGGHSGDDWPMAAMRRDRWMLVHDETKTRVELYDVVSDRGQTHDLSGQHPELTSEMMAELAGWLESLPRSSVPVGDGKAAMPVKKKALTAKPGLDRAAVLKRKDIDGDGSLTLEEFSKNFPDAAIAKERFFRFDANGDGRVDAAEYQ